ncbi:MAG: FemAB family XrtA/PEP-CTERM system-associated protein [Pseudomonadota bacterium]
MSAALETVPTAADPSVSVRQATAADAARWDAFVLSSDEATFFHRFGWGGVIERTYGHKPRFLIAEADGEVVGVAPLVHVKTMLFGSALIATAFTVGGGLAAASQPARAALAIEAAKLGDSLGVDYVELRSETASLPEWKTKEGVYAVFRGPIPENEDENLKLVPRKKRADVRKGIKAAGEGAIIAEANASVSTVYHLYAESVRNLGTPVFPEKLLHEIAAAFSDDVEFSVVSKEGQPLAGLVTFFHRETALPYYGGALPAARAAHAYDYLYWSLMRRASARGATEFDFGRSKIGTGAYDYKKFWGFEATPLQYQYHLVKADAVPDVNPNNPKYAVFVSAWKKLPTAVSTRLGPFLARQLA